MYNRKREIYTSMRARIWLRKTNPSLVTNGSIQERAEAERVKKGNGGELTVEEIVEALERGDEVCYFLSLPVRFS
jgi:hypothetical protein